MARPDRTPIERIPTSEPVRSPELPQITARPVDMTLAPRVDPELAGLARGLAAFAPSLDRYGEQRLREQAAEETQKGKLAAEQGQFNTYEEGYKALSSQANPWFQKAYMEEVGRRSAQDYGRKLQEHLAANTDPNNPDPVATRKLVQEFYANETRGMQDPDYLAGFNAPSQRFNAQALDAVTAAQATNVREKSVDLLRGAADDFLGDKGRPTRWLDDLKDKAVSLNIPRGEAERSAFEQTAARAVAEADPRLLDVFEYDTRDGQTSFAVREPQAYAAARKAAEVALRGRMKDNSEVMKYQLEVRLATSIEAAKGFQQPLNMAEVQQDLFNAVDTGVFKADSAASIYKQAMAADRDYRRAYSNASAWRSGAIGAGSGFTADGSTGPVTGSDAAAAASIGAKQIAREVMEDRTIPEEQKESVILSNIIDTSIRNRMIFPDHLSSIKLAANDLPQPDAQGNIKMPDGFAPAAAIAYAYWKKDPDLFRNSFGGDKHASSVYERYFTNLERDPNKDPQLAWRMTISDLGPSSVPGKEITVNPALIADVVKAAGKAVNGRPEWFERYNPFGGRSVKAPNFDEDVYLQNYLRTEISDAYKTNPSIKADAAASIAAKRFESQHGMVNGQWLNTSSIPGGLNEGQLAELEKALNAYKTVAARDSNLGLTAEEAADASITLSPRPVSVDPSLGPQHVVYINGMPTASRVNPEILLQQYVNGRFVSPERIAGARALVSNIDTMAQAPLQMTDKSYADALDALKFNKQNGFMTDGAVDSARKKLDKAHDEYVSQTKVVNAIEDTKARRDAVPAVKALTSDFKPFDAADLADLKAPGKFTANIPAAIAQVRSATKAGRYAAAAQALVGGYGVTRYATAGDARVGLGYSLLQPDDVVKSDLMRGLKIDQLQTGRILTALRKGEYRLNDYEAQQLFEAQANRVAKDLQKHYADAWVLLPDNKRDALVVAAINSKGGKWKDTISAMERNDWDAVRANLNVVDEHRKAASAAIRLLSSGHQTFRSVSLNNF